MSGDRKELQVKSRKARRKISTKAGDAGGESENEGLRISPGHEIGHQSGKLLQRKRRNAENSLDYGSHGNLRVVGRSLCRLVVGPVARG
jgi:hypothetical protein